MFAWLLHKPDKHGSGDPGCPGPPVSLKAPKSFSSPRTASHFLPASPLCSAPRLPPAPKLLAPQPAGVTRKCRGVRAPGLLEQWGMGVMGKCPFLSQGMILRHAPTLLQGVSDAPKEPAHWEQAARELVICTPSPLLQQCMHAKLLQSCPTLCNPMDNNPPGSSVHGISQARILEWIVMPSSRGSF